MLLIEALFLQWLGVTRGRNPALLLRGLNALTTGNPFLGKQILVT